MDEQRFDAALRALQTGTTRRAGLAAALGVIFGGAGLASARGEHGREQTRARRKPSAEGPCGDGSARANKCARNSECCTKYCAEGSCRCKPNWMTCGKNEHCCSGRCIGGRCDGGAKPAGSACVENFNCQDGLACIAGRCTASNKAKCTRSNCPGCCDGTSCRVGRVAQACGSGGGTCRRCAAGVSCADGVCKKQPRCNAETCRNGCCDGTTCVTATSASACGTGGAACMTCSSATPLCSAGTCSAGTWAYNAQFGSQGSGDDNFTNPKGIFVSADGLTAWVADTNNGRISIWTRPNAASTTWSFSAQIGSLGAGDDNFSGPRDVYLSEDTLTAWVADTGNSRISIWTRPDAASTAWSYSTQFGTLGAGDDNLSSPCGVFVSADLLTAWVADTGNNRIVLWTRPDATSTTWSYSTQFGAEGSGNENFGYPQSVVVSADLLTAWVADQANNRIVLWTRPDATSTTWGYSTQFGTQGSGNDNFSIPQGVFVAPDTLTAWVADRSNNRIVLWTRPDTASTTWSYSTQFGTQGDGNDNFDGAASVFVSANSLTAWVADYFNSRIVIWTQG